MHINKKLNKMKKGCVVRMSEIKCKSCRNESICKWCNDMKFKQEQIDKIPVTRGLTPVRIEIECESYERKNKKTGRIL